MADKVAFLIVSFSPLSDQMNVSLTLMSVHVRQFWLLLDCYYWLLSTLHLQQSSVIQTKDKAAVSYEPFTRTRAKDA